MISTHKHTLNKQCCDLIQQLQRDSSSSLVSCGRLIITDTPERMCYNWSLETKEAVIHSLNFRMIIGSLLINLNEILSGVIP